MSCEFISELRRLSKLSAEAVQNIDHFDSLKRYMHITRKTETDFRELISRIAGVNHKQLILVCGSAGDGKSHLLSYLNSCPDSILSGYKIINDATESDAPDQTAIETLAGRIEAFRDDHLDDGGCEKVVLAINLGMLNNFIDSEQGKDYTRLRLYVLNNNIFSVAQPQEFNEDDFFHHIDFSDYQLYTLTADGPKSDYLTELFAKVFDENPDNRFYSSYVTQGAACPHHAQCPVRHNFEFLMRKEVRELLIQRIIEVCVKEKTVVTSRDVLNFIFDAIVSPNFDKDFWNILSNPARFLQTYISYTTPMLIFESKGTSSLIDCLTENATSNENIESRDSDVLSFYAADDITPVALSVLDGTKYAEILKNSGLASVDNGKDHLKKYVYKFLMNYRKLQDKATLTEDKAYISFVRDLFNSYAGNPKSLKNLYGAVKHGIFAWNGIYGDELICIDDSSDEYSILEKLTIKEKVVKGKGETEIFQFSPVVLVTFCNESETESVSFTIDYNLYKVIMKMKDGYCPTSQDRNIHADFSSRIVALSEFGSKKSRVYIVPKRNDTQTAYIFEANAFEGYNFKEV